MTKKPTSTHRSSSTSFRLAGRFFAWWMEQLGTFIPSRLRSWWQKSENALLARIDASRAQLFRAGTGELARVLEVALDEKDFSPLGNAVERVATAVGKDRRAMLLLPEDRVLRRQLLLPATVEENIRQTLAFELDRYTPFKATQAGFDFRLLRREGNRILVDLVVVPLAIIDQGLRGLRSLGLTGTGAVLANDFLEHGANAFNLLPLAARESHRPAGKRQWLRMLAVLLTSILSFGCLAFPVWQKRQAAIDLLAPMEQAIAAARETDALRDRLVRLSDDHNLLPNEKWDGHSALRIVDELSKLLPDDTFLIQFEFDGRTIQIQGESGSSATLIETLENSPMLKNVGFKAQLTKIQGTSFDRFHISADLELTERERRASSSRGNAPASTPAPTAESSR